MNIIENKYFQDNSIYDPITGTWTYKELAVVYNNLVIDDYNNVYDISQGNENGISLLIRLEKEKKYKISNSVYWYRDILTKKFPDLHFTIADQRIMVYTINLLSSLICPVNKPLDLVITEIKLKFNL